MGRMAIGEIHPEPVDGPWIEGFVLDRRVISSRPIEYLGEHMQFETTRSPLGELVYQLKYRNGRPDDIIETAVTFVKESLHRTNQPAVIIAEGIAAILGVSSLPFAAIKATATQQMKHVLLHERAPLLSAAIQAARTRFRAGGFCSSMTCGRLVVR